MDVLRDCLACGKRLVATGLIVGDSEVFSCPDSAQAEHEVLVDEVIARQDAEYQRRKAEQKACGIPGWNEGDEPPWL